MIRPLHERLPAHDSPEFDQLADELFKTLCTLVVAKRDIEESLEALALIATHHANTHSSLHRALCRAAVVAYARPFIAKGTDGLNRLKEKHYVPAHRRELHAELIDHRQSVVAHSPVRESEPTMTMYAEDVPPHEPSRYIIIVGHTHVDMTVERVEDMTSLGKEVIALIDADRAALHERFERAPAIALRLCDKALPLPAGTLVDSEHQLLPPAFGV